MGLKSWFLDVATIGRSAAARYADIPVEDFRAAAEDLGYGPKLTLAQIEEIVESFVDPDDEELEDTEDSDDEDEA